jgi:pantothenate synthetase
MAEVVEASPVGTLDYVEVVDAATLRPVDVVGPGCRLFGAVRFGRARLIDNIPVDGAARGAEP